MLFRVFRKNELKTLFDALARDSLVVGPVKIGVDRSGRPLHAFEPVPAFSHVDLQYTTTKLPAKRYFLPPRETMASFHISDHDWTKSYDLTSDRPCVLFGLHPCDINALNRLDKVLLQSLYPMPSYAAKRANMFIVGFDCTPQPFCFCRSMGADTALHGFDMFITDIGSRYFVEILSAQAFNVLKCLSTAAPDEEDHAEYRRTVAGKNGLFTAQVDTTDLAKILDMEFQAPVWTQWGDRCLGCGTCSSVCPTCYCYGVEELVQVNLREAAKIRTSYSCTLVDFAQVAGGHNFRPERQTRLKYRYYHKHRGFVEAYEEPLCVGCGRCGESCLAGITVPDVIASVRSTALDLQHAD